MTPTPRATSAASIDLPAARALAEGLGEWQSVLDEGTCGLGPNLRTIETTLRSLCDEVERLREALTREPSGRFTVWPARPLLSGNISGAMVLDGGGAVIWHAWVDYRDGEDMARRSTERANAVANALNALTPPAGEEAR